MAMLKREEPAVAVVGSDLNALLGRGSEFDGKLTFEGTVRIDGRFTGTVVTKDTLVVGEGAHVNAEVTCGTLIVHGNVTGNVKASTVEFHPPARVNGNIETGALIVARGATFTGNCKMEPPAKPAAPAVVK